MSLRAAAKSHREGAVVFYLLPIRGIGFQLAVRWAREKWGPESETWPPECGAFIMAVPATVDLELDNDASDEEQMLRVFWENRTHDLDQDWALFLQCVTVDMVNAWDDAYDQTRKSPLQADESLQSVPDEGWTDDQKKDDTPNSSASRNTPDNAPKTTLRKKAVAS